MSELRAGPLTKHRTVEIERTYAVSRVRRGHQHRHEPVGKRRRGNSQGDRESASGDHDQVLPLTMHETGEAAVASAVSHGERFERRAESRRGRR